MLYLFHSLNTIFILRALEQVFLQVSETPTILHLLIVFFFFTQLQLFNVLFVKTILVVESTIQSETPHVTAQWDATPVFLQRLEVWIRWTHLQSLLILFTSIPSGESEQDPIAGAEVGRVVVEPVVAVVGLVVLDPIGAGVEE